MHLTLASFTDRINFASWLNEKGLVGLAVEIGTHRGEHAKIFLHMWRGEMLFCIDHWQAGYDPDDPASHGDRGEDMNLAKRTLSSFSSRVVFLQQESTTASSKFGDGSLDFVYVDACHRYEAVLADLRAWWPKLKPGGVLAGHDILSCVWERDVQKAVAEFAGDRSVFLVPAPGTDPWSYYMVK